MTRNALIGLVLAAVAFGLGRASVRPDPLLAARVAQWQDSTAVYRAARDRAARLAAVGQEQAAADSARAVDWEARARRAERVAADAAHRADGARALLASAETAPDSLTGCMGALTARETECAALRQTAAGLDSALSAERDGAVALRDVIRVQDGQLATDSRRLGQADQLIGDLRRAVRGCRVPLVGFRCPVAGLAYDASDGGLLAGVSYPATGLIHIGVVWRVAR